MPRPAKNRTMSSAAPKSHKNNILRRWRAPRGMKQMMKRSILTDRSSQRNRIYWRKMMNIIMLSRQTVIKRSMQQASRKLMLQRCSPHTNRVGSCPNKGPHLGGELIQAPVLSMTPLSRIRFAHLECFHRFRRFS